MQWATRTGEVVGTAALGLVLALAVPLVDPVGRVLLGGAAVLLLAVAAHDGLLRPRLQAGDDGVAVRTLSGTTTISWPRLQVRVRDQRRWGLRTHTLELEDRADDAVLVVLGRRDLGAEPAVVAEALHAAAG